MRAQEPNSIWQPPQATLKAIEKANECHLVEAESEVLKAHTLQKPLSPPQTPGVELITELLLERWFHAQEVRSTALEKAKGQTAGPVERSKGSKELVQESLKPSEGVFKVIFWLGYFNSCVNPLIYPCSSREFKRAFLRLLRCQCHRSRQHHRPLWSIYGHHWQASNGGPRPDYAPGPGAAPSRALLAHTAPSAPGSPGTPKAQAPVVGRRKPPCAFRKWRLLVPFQRPTTQLHAKVCSLSQKKHAREAACALHLEVEAVSLGVPSDAAEGTTCQAYELANSSHLRETDI
ncbi:hypothetical protein J1605_001128 [Eschrichtius robustus]|uniref:Alpha-1B adrenergic receptor n=1 Tax=Eschrichtius robustus TaxID=9764 RepID=A0AB34GE79_ESCRO|nr:hypothetical protein J1605_001128 [Eschrichtius robustus]